MATKRKRPTAVSGLGAAGVGPGPMAAADMNRPVGEGLTEMPAGETHAGTGVGAPGVRPIRQGGLMPGENPAGAGGAPEDGMPAGRM